jgi:hypothetical protein
LAKCNDSDDSRDLTNGDRGSLITAVIEEATAATTIDEAKASVTAASAAVVASAAPLVAAEAVKSSAAGEAT